MAMTKKYYEIVASNMKRALDALQDIPEDSPGYQSITMVVETLSQSMAQEFAANDPKFNRAKFLELCGVEEQYESI